MSFFSGPTLGRIAVCMWWKGKVESLFSSIMLFWVLFRLFSSLLWFFLCMVFRVVCCLFWKPWDPYFIWKPSTILSIMDSWERETRKVNTKKWQSDTVGMPRIGYQTICCSNSKGILIITKTVKNHIKFYRVMMNLPSYLMDTQWWYLCPFTHRCSLESWTHCLKLILSTIRQAMKINFTKKHSNQFDRLESLSSNYLLGQHCFGSSHLHVFPHDSFIH